MLMRYTHLYDNRPSVLPFGRVWRNLSQCCRSHSTRCDIRAVQRATDLGIIFNIDTI
jgi:hypothetical protein